MEVHLDRWLSEFGAPREARLSAPDLPGLIGALEAQYPRLRGKMRDDTGAMRRFVRIFVNGEPVEGLDSAVALGPDDRVDILHSIAGG
ncbi:thiamine S protein [mine drainage metagenome]|uniref:Thiamine S protein n=1 Tax=mine drainage metagenome TaxID=410659 RepID=T0YBR1_9ZZZZ